MTYYNSTYKSKYQNNYQKTFTDDEEGIIDQVVKLWNDTQEYLKPVKLLSDDMKESVLSAYSKFNLGLIEECFIKVNDTDNLNGMKPGKEWHCSFDWVFKGDNFEKIMNGNYDDIYAEKVNQQEDYYDDREPFDAKRVYYILKQKQGIFESDSDFEEKYKFTEDEKERCIKAGKFIDGKYISDEDDYDDNFTWYEGDIHNEERQKYLEEETERRFEEQKKNSKTMQKFLELRSEENLQGMTQEEKNNSFAEHMEVLTDYETEIVIQQLNTVKSDFFPKDVYDSNGNFTKESGYSFNDAEYDDEYEDVS